MALLALSGCSYSSLVVEPQTIESSPTSLESEVEGEGMLSKDGKVRFYEQDGARIFEGVFESPTLRSQEIFPNRFRGRIEYHETHPEYGKCIILEAKIGPWECRGIDGVWGDPDGRIDVIQRGNKEPKIIRSEGDLRNRFEVNFYNNLTNFLLDTTEYIALAYEEYPPQ